MAKQGKKQTERVEQLAEDVVETVQDAELVAESSEQAVRSAENFANGTDEKISDEPEQKEKIVADKMEHAEMANIEQKQKSGGTGIALLALLVALGLGGAGYFFGQQKLTEVESRLMQVEQRPQQMVQTAVEMPNFEAEKAQIAKLTAENKAALDKIAQLTREQNHYTQQIQSLQAQVQKLGAAPKAEPTAFLLSDADFLLSNARRKMVIDNDIETAKSLLVEADNVLSQLQDPTISTVREALKADFDSLKALNKVDQNNLMQRLAQLANLVDDMQMLDNEQQVSQESGEVSDSLADWQKNIEKSADSFLSHFIRVTDKKLAKDKGFIAPNQEIYLRENIRLRLQIAILAVPRQQNELYKQSLDAVSTWVRSYFDTQNKNVRDFLIEVDDLIEQSIYIDAPNKLQSLTLLKQKLNRSETAVDKIELEVDKAVEQLNQPAATEQPAAAEVPSAQ